MAKTQASYFCDVNEHPSHFSFYQPKHLFQRAHSLGLQSTGSSRAPGGDPHVSLSFSGGGQCCDSSRYQEQREVLRSCYCPYREGEDLHSGNQQKKPLKD